MLYPKPEDLADIPQRELLSWEKELAGTYLSNHPIQKYLPAIKAAKTTMLGELDDNMHGQQVTVAGMINFVRHHQTKKGDPMAFVEIEDIQAAREIVVFPRAYADHKELLVNGNLIVVRGKVDAPEGRILKILADSISNEIITYGAIGEVPATYDVTPSTTLPLLESQTSAPKQQNGSNGQQSTGAALSTSTAVPLQKTAQAEQQPKKPPAPRRLRITIRRTGDLAQDKHRLRIVYSLLTKKPGRDQFVLYIPNGNNKVQIDFPNQTTHYTAGLEQELVRMLGATAVRVD